MQKFILIVPHTDKNNYKINHYYTNKISSFGKYYYICDYNIKNINFDMIEGILLTGGGDINPKFYNENNKKCSNICNRRDVFEIWLLRQALKRKIPTLAICRGLQVMNVAFLGTLHQHIKGHMQKKEKFKPTHYVDIALKSNLFDILKKDKIKVNSFHHQAIGNVAKGFDVVAKKGNVIEAIEHNDKNLFFMGLQWHPEALQDINSYNIFKSFINSLA